MVEPATQRPDLAQVEATLEAVARAGTALVDLQFSDIVGGAKSLTIPADSLGNALNHGYRFDGAAMVGGVRQTELDLYLVPDPSTLAIIPTPPDTPGRARLYCSVFRRDGQPFAGDPRAALERTLTAAGAAGYDYRVGFEIEYYLLRPDADGANVDSLLPITAQPAGYFAIGDETFAAVRDDVVTTLHEFGVGVGGAHHETGPGQEEIDILQTGGIRMADQIMTIRSAIRTVALRHGVRATFMPKPLPNAPGSGMHLFQRLARYPEGGDLLREGGGDHLSTTARHMIAGQLAHAAAMCAVLCPTVNSYKRLSAGHRAPRHATWARVGQSALIRVPAWAADEDGALELRCPDALANPYLALAVTLACALDGIKRGEEPPDPRDEGLIAYDDAELSRLGTPRLPLTIGEALGAMAEDDVIRATLGDYIFDQFLAVKQAEWEDYRRFVSPWEHERYGDA